MRLQGKRILIIDDDPVLKTLLTRVVEAAGCSVVPCNGVRDALKVLEEAHPDVVILDLNMPEFDGFTFLKFRRQNKLLSTVPVIVLSGSKDIQKALEMGAEQFLQKPFEARIILQKLRFTFFKRENFTYKLSTAETATVLAEVSGELTGQCTGRLKLESQIRFSSGKSVIVDADDYNKSAGSPLVCVIERHPIDLKDGLFQTPISITGLTVDEKSKVEKWLRSLSE